MRYFRTYEFDCVCRHNCGLGFNAMDVDFLERLETARAIADVKFKINSAIRCQKHNNDLINSSENSAHLTGHAVDIAAETSHKKFKILYGLIKAGFDRVGVYENFIHADTDPHKIPKVLWRG